MSREISTVGVIGLGTMGAGIVEVFAKGGRQVVAVDGTPELAERGRGFLTASLDKAVSRGKLEQSAREEILGRVRFTDQLADLSRADLVIEAVPERLEIKRDIFQTLDGIVRPDAILASNTSSLSLTALAALTQHPERVVGMHFFNPAPVLRLVEVITTILVQHDVVDAIRDLATDLGKQPVVVRDRAGFVANALLITYLARAIRTYETGHVSREDLDNAGRIGIGLPMGPLTLADLIGLDVTKEVCDVLFEATKQPSAAPPALLQQMVVAGRLGRKTGRGFYVYDGSEPAPAQPARAAATSVAVLGDSSYLGDLVSRLSEAGVSVDEQPAPTGTVSAQVILLVDAPDLGGEDDEAAQDSSIEPYAATLGSVPTSSVVVVTDEDAALAAAAFLPEGVAVVPVSLHAPTKGGQLAEVVRAGSATDAAVDLVRGTFEAASVTTLAARDRSGLVVDALLLPHLNDAAKMLDSGYASAQDIDTAMVAGCGYPQGPFGYIDQLGAATVTDGLFAIYAETGDGAVFPSPLLVEHAESGDAFLS